MRYDIIEASAIVRDVHYNLKVYGHLFEMFFLDINNTEIDLRACLKHI